VLGLRLDFLFLFSMPLASVFPAVPYVCNY
jgi:hypothetical protein